MIQSTETEPARVLGAASDDFWSSIGMSPATLSKNRKPTEVYLAVKKKIVAIGKPQLSGICNFLGISIDPQDDAEKLAEKFIDSCNLDTLLCLVEFQKRRAVFIARAFVALVPVRRFSGSFQHTGASLKPLTQLLILFSQSPEHLKEVFYSHLWESKRTHTDFTTSEPLPTSFLNKLKSNSTAFSESLSKCWGRPVRVFGVHKLQNDLTVIAFDREYSPTIQRDFREDFSVHFRCGDIIFGISKDRDTVHVKTQNSNLTTLIQRLVENLFEETLTPMQSQTFSDYDPDLLKNCLLGNYDIKSRIQITAAGFRRTALESRSSLVLSCVENNHPIRNDLVRLKESGIVTLDSLDDVEMLCVSLEEKVSRIDVQAVPGGAVRFSLDDSHCTADHTDAVKAAFHDSFGIPLNRLIDPRKLLLGNVGIISYLLNIRFESEVQAFQRDTYDLLLKLGILFQEEKTGRACKRGICSAFERPVANPELRQCPVCDSSLKPHSYYEVVRDNAVIRRFLGDRLKEIGWQLSDPRSFESNEYIPVTMTSDTAGEPVWMMLRDSLPEKSQIQMERSSQALLVVGTRGVDRHVYVDSTGIGRLNLSYVIASQHDQKLHDECSTACQKLLSDLRRSTAQRIAKAAEHSFQHLRAGTEGDPGHVYETDVFNLLRTIFPYSYKLGREGYAEPDGFVCVPVYGKDGSRDLGNVNSWNWTYDAKHSDKASGYDLNIAERRKMVEYVNSIRSKRSFMGETQKIRAHVILSNNVSDSKMRSTAEYFFGEDGVKAVNRDVKLIRMKQEFLTTLYEAFTNDPDGFRKRQPIIGECFVDLMAAEPKSSFLDLGRSEALDLISEIQSVAEIEAVPKKSDVIKGLDSKR